jgi:F0F1-type ATP synthase delta subunit
MAQLDYLATQIFNKNTDVKKLMKQIFPLETTEKLDSVFQKNNINFYHLPSVESFLKNLKQAIKALPVVGLTLAFTPNEELTKKISTWLSSRLANHVLINLTIKPEIMAGAIIEYKGRYKDYSLFNRTYAVFCHPGGSVATDRISKDSIVPTDVGTPE